MNASALLLLYTNCVLQSSATAYQSFACGGLYHPQISCDTYRVTCSARAMRYLRSARPLRRPTATA